MTSRLIHYSKKPFTGPVRSVPQGGIAGAFKPVGFWVSVEGPGQHGWREWCEAEQWGLDRLEHQAEIVLKITANVLCLTSARDLDSFTRKYGKRLLPQLTRTVEPDWHQVAAEYQGIIIAPYIWDRRMQHLWYYGWDCASGCIWDGNAVAEVNPIPKEEA